MTIGSVPSANAKDRSPIQARDSIPEGIEEWGFSGPEAAELAAISYRQLDYWARRGWIVPSRVSLRGVQRRVYSPMDIVRLAGLGHLGRSRVNVAAYGRETGRLRLSDSPDFLIVWAVHVQRVLLTSARDLRHVVGRPGRYVIFDPAPVLGALHDRGTEARMGRPRRRTFSVGYKLKVLDEYDHLSEPGAKASLLRRESLHTSHLVAWRRWRDAQAAPEPKSSAALDRPDNRAGRRSSTDRPRHVLGTDRRITQPA